MAVRVAVVDENALSTGFGATRGSEAGGHLDTMQMKSILAAKAPRVKRQAHGLHCRCRGPSRGPASPRARGSGDPLVDGSEHVGSREAATTELRRSRWVHAACCRSRVSSDAGLLPSGSARARRRWAKSEEYATLVSDLMRKRAPVLALLFFT